MPAPPPEDLRIDAIDRMQRGLCAYVSYLAACEMNQAFSEYVLYEPILRILTAQQYNVRCEVECPGITHAKRGDRRRLDFLASREGVSLAIEVKWAKDSRVAVARDIEKLRAVSRTVQRTMPLLIVFGRKSHLELMNLSVKNLRELRKPRYADLGRTRYGCRVFTLREPTG